MLLSPTHTHDRQREEVSENTGLAQSVRSWHQSCLTRVKKRLGERKGLERGRRKRWRRGRKDWTSREPEATAPAWPNWNEEKTLRERKRLERGRRGTKDWTSREFLDCWVSFTNRKTFDNTIIGSEPLFF